MRGLTLPFVPTKTYRSISLDLREKRKIFFFLSLSLFPRSHSLPLPPLFLYFLFLFDFSFSSFFPFNYFFYFPYFIYFFLILSFPYFPPLDTWLNVVHSHKCTTCHAMCYPTPDASKNVKFRMSWNPTKINRVTRFREMNSTVKSVSSSEIYKIYGFQPK